MRESTYVNGTQGANADGYAATMQEDPGEHGGLEHEDVERDSARRARSAMRSRIWSPTRFKIQRKEWDDQYSRRHLGKKADLCWRTYTRTGKSTYNLGERTKLNISGSRRKTADGCNLRLQRSVYFILGKSSSSHTPRRHHRYEA